MIALSDISSELHRRIEVGICPTCSYMQGPDATSCSCWTPDETDTEGQTVKMIAAAQRLTLVCDLSKASVRRLAREATLRRTISLNECADVLRILDDKTQTAEDALSELESSLVNKL